MRLPQESRYLVILALLGSGVLFSATIDPGDAAVGSATVSYSAIDPAAMHINYLGGMLQLEGHSVSLRQESRVRQLVDEEFRAAALDFRPLVPDSDSWASLTAATLHLIASSDSASASLSERTLQVRAVVSDHDAWHRRMRHLDATLPENFDLRVDTIEVQESSADLCQRAFEEFRSMPVSFERGSDRLRSASHGVLDRHVEFAFDCPQYAIGITGHTDNVGDESGNLALSLARADAVAEYLSSRGVPEAQIETTGAGSSRPVADNNTAWGRVRNRRIEFALVERETTASL